MIASMTAFARLEDSGDWGRAIWEIRSVNHRYLEIGLRLPDDMRVLENKIRERISAKLQRGKVDCTLRYEPDETRMGDITINQVLADKLVSTAQALSLGGPAAINPIASVVINVGIRKRVLKIPLRKPSRVATAMPANTGQGSGTFMFA